MGSHQDIRNLILTIRSGDNTEDGQKLLNLFYSTKKDGINQSDEKVIQIPIEQFQGYRDAFLELFSSSNNKKIFISVSNFRLSLQDITNLLTVYDCSMNFNPTHQKHYCTPKNGYEWGCLHLHSIQPIYGTDKVIDTEQTRQKIKNECEQRFIANCQHFDQMEIDKNIIRLERKTASELNLLETKAIISNNAEQLMVINTDIIPRKIIPLVSYSDIGGLNEVIQVLRETIELPLKHPELLAHFGIKPHRGILLYGPPGCGKTLLAKAVAHESGANFISISGPELITKWHGESEDNLRKLFEQAKNNQPSIIFFDEIDAIAQSRSSDENLRLDSRFTTQLLTLLDGIYDPGEIFMLATTNRIDLLDRALLRPGRFDKIIEIPPPDVQGRLSILQIHTRQMPLDINIKLELIVKEIGEATGADIAYLAREAAYACLRRKFKLDDVMQIKFPLPSETLNNILVEAVDFSTAVKLLKLREQTIIDG